MVCIKQRGDLTFALVAGSIPGCGLTTILLSDQPGTPIAFHILFNHVTRIVCRSIVAHDQFNICVSLC
jgi:hypothetical protein